MSPERLREMLNDTPETRAEMSPERSLEGMKFCSPTGEEPRWMIFFEDAEMGHKLYELEAEAREAFEVLNTGWNCWLFSPTPAVRAELSPKQGEPTEVTDADRRMAVRLCNSGGAQVDGVMPERRVAELLAKERALDAKAVGNMASAVAEVRAHLPNAPDDTWVEKHCPIEISFAQRMLDANAEVGRLQEECMESWRAMQDALRTRAIFMTYDSLGDVPDPCGLWCDVCKEHIETDRLTGHKENCLLSERAILALPKVGE